MKHVLFLFSFLFFSFYEILEPGIDFPIKNKVTCMLSLHSSRFLASHDSAVDMDE